MILLNFQVVEVGVGSLVSQLNYPHLPLPYLIFALFFLIRTLQLCQKIFLFARKIFSSLMELEKYDFTYF